MKISSGFVCAFVTAVATQCAIAGPITDKYWGADSHGYGDVIGDSSFDISGASITRVGSVLTVIVATNFAGQAGADNWAAPGGIGYGDLFLAPAWTPYGADATHGSDNAANGTRWTFGFSLNDRWSNTGGTFELYRLHGTDNGAAIVNAESMMSCQIGTQCFYRNGQAAAVNTASAAASDTGMRGNWSVTPGQALVFSVDVGATDLAKYSMMALHWGETCQNDVIEGATDLPSPGSLPLVALGLMALFGYRKRSNPAENVVAAASPTVAPVAISRLVTRTWSSPCCQGGS